MFAVLTAHGVVLIWRFIIVCQNGIVISKLKLVFFQKSHRVVFDRIGNLVFEKFQRLFSGSSDGVLGVTCLLYTSNKSSVTNLNTIAHISLLAVAVAAITTGTGQSYRKLKAVKRIA